MTTQVSIDSILSKFPNILSPAEMQLPPEKRGEVLRQRVAAIVQSNRRNAEAQKAAQLAAQQAAQQKAAAGIMGAAVAGQPGAIRPPNPAGLAGPSQSPRIGMQQPQLQMNGQPQMNQNVSGLVAKAQGKGCLRQPTVVMARAHGLPR